MCFPWLFLVLTIMAMLGSGMFQVAFILGIPWGIANARTVRGVVLSTKENAFVEAAIATGCSTSRILLIHILPQLYAPLIILFTVTLGGAILGEALSLIHI